MENEGVGMKTKTLFTNSLENMRCEIIDYFHLIQLKDRFGHLWDIQKISIDAKTTILYLGNEGTDNYKVCSIPYCISSTDDIYDLDEYEIVMKKEKNMILNERGMPMDIDEFLDSHNLEYKDIIIKDEDGNIIKHTPLLKGAYLLSFDGNTLVVR